MGIYNPQTFLSGDDKELLLILGGLLLETHDRAPQSNLNVSDIALSQREALRLLDLLEQFLNSKKFVEGSYFIEGLLGDLGPYDPNIREIYLSWRKRHGRSRAMSTVHWRRYINRLGIVKEPSGYLAGGFVIDAEKMPLSYFVQMERKLLNSTNLNPRVVDLLLNFVRDQEYHLEEIRIGRDNLRFGLFKSFLVKIASIVKSNSYSVNNNQCITKSQLSSVMLIVADFGALFTTRDWDVCGTLSAVAAAIPHIRD